MPLNQDAEEQTFQQMWEDAKSRFKDLTNKNLTQSTNRSLEEVIDLINKKFDSSEPENGGKHKRFKELALNILNLLQILGGIAAQGTASVFGPAAMCFNAMSYLFEIPNKLRKFRTDLQHLLNRLRRPRCNSRSTKELRSSLRWTLSLSEALTSLWLYLWTSARCASIL